MRLAMMTIFGLVLGYAVGAGVTGLLVSLFSSNAHDKGLETVMTAFFAGGPIGAIIGAAAGFMWARKRRVHS